MKIIESQQVIQSLGLIPLPQEGGFFRETYRSDQTIAGDILGQPNSGSRSTGTAIYCMVTLESFSSLHRLKHDEIFHYYLGDVAEMLQIFPDGSHALINIGPDVLVGQQPQIVVRAGVWQATRVKRGGKFTLFGTTMAPGFDFRDFELGNPEDLKKQYPAISALIEGFTNASGKS